MGIEFRRVEDSKDKVKMPLHSKNVTQRIICSFNTDRLGLVQVVGKNNTYEPEDIENINMSLSTTSVKSDLDMLTELEKEYVETYMKAVLLVVFYPDELAN